MIEFLLEYDTAGDPITGLKWSRRTTEKIALALGDFGIIVSPNTVTRLLHQMGYSLRVNHKQLSTDGSPDRNDQFLYLGDLRQHFQRRGLPIISVDTKKRELVGNFKNLGPRWDLSPQLPKGFLPESKCGYWLNSNKGTKCDIRFRVTPFA